jgi:hypothetical protein
MLLTTSYNHVKIRLITFIILVIIKVHLILVMYVNYFGTVKFRKTTEARSHGEDIESMKDE